MRIKIFAIVQSFGLGSAIAFAAACGGSDVPIGVGGSSPGNGHPTSTLGSGSGSGSGAINVSPNGCLPSACDGLPVPACYTGAGAPPVETQLQCVFSSISNACQYQDICIYFEGGCTQASCDDQNILTPDGEVQANFQCSPDASGTCTLSLCPDNVPPHS